MNDPAEFSDICAHLGDDYDRFHGSIIPPIYQNTVFTRKRTNHGYSYSRMNNPTTEILEKKLAALEKTEAARVFSSGMGAITATLTSLLKSGDHVVAISSAYYPTVMFLRDKMARFGVVTDFVKEGTLEEIEAAVRPETAMIYLESPSSIIYKVQDLRAISAFASKRGITTVIDNTWATPFYQNPVTLGIDYVIHSLTKYIGGHGDVCAGVVAGSGDNIKKIRENDFSGAALDPFAAWLLIRSLRTLELRMIKHGENAKKVAEFLANNKKVKRVFWPGLPSDPGHVLAVSQMNGFSGLMSFVLDTDNKKAYEFVKNLEVFEEGPSWGGFESLVNALGMTEDEDYLKFTTIPKGLIRISVGLENVETILNDLEQSLSKL